MPSRYHGAACFPQPHCVLADIGNTHSAKAAKLVRHLYCAMAAEACPEPAARRPTREAYSVLRHNYPERFVVP